ncbi:peptidylprolyl isomerase [Candidatus Phycosocius spiralis]|uniref:Parvulin-like PPIase n=1 Tax=Candidatus Phycosocius spiralis TaxID=2815099 RepID=A0ABQ4PSR5_9PROT|nr:peptidylprolyl isomerase [Candidatus Phycosocius spiralis]GIU66008.1 chaperone SurA [Candidatus Phycosocius spiralis]
MRKWTIAACAGALARGAMLALCCAIWFQPEASWAQARPLNEGLAAVVNDQPITRLDVRQRVQFLIATSGAQQVTPELIQSATSAALNSLIDERLQMQEAAKFKVEVPDREIDRILANQARQNGSTLDKFFLDLGEIGVSPQSYRDKTRAEVVWQRIVSGRFGSRVRINRDQVKAALDRILANTNKPQYLISEIFLEDETPQSAPQTFEGAKTLVQQLRTGTPFQLIAQQYSFAPSASTGGDMGWITLGELKSEVAHIVEKLPPGTISDPIVVPGGVMIVSVREKREPNPPRSKLKLKEMSRTVPVGADETVWRRAEQAGRLARDSLKNGCEGVNRAAKRGSMEVVDFGEIQDDELSEPFKSQALNLSNGQASEVFRSDKGVHVLVLCERETTGNDIPTLDQLEDRLYEQELSLIARRYLRDIRREAAIIQP